jgi:superfamily II DNA or RNA helicase
LLSDFYVPCLQEATRYDRAVGFFRSTLIQVTAIAFSDFVRRGGQMRLICSPAITPEDFEAAKEASTLSAQAQRLVREELETLLETPASVPAAKLLGALVGAGVVEMRLAFLSQEGGIFHDKVGVFQDEGGARVSFVGSANETWAAWGLNHESFEVFCSWRSEADLLRTRRHDSYFEKLWTNAEPGVHVERLDNVTTERLVEIADADVDEAIETVRRGVSAKPSGRDLMPHQAAVLESWRNAGHRGIVAFATGAGKTLTALRAVDEWTSAGRPALILVPGQELHRQWTAEIAVEIPAATPLLCGAGAGVAEWGPLLGKYTAAAGLSEAGSRRIVLATNSTFSSLDFQNRLQHGDHLLVVGDEMHRLGSRRALAALERCDAGATLGLSATYRRQFDEAGTGSLVSWFGPVLDPVIGIAEAIAMGRLVPYDYRLHTLELEPDEVASYLEITDRIRRAAGGDANEPSEYLRMLWIQRARILKQASGKAGKAVEILSSEFRPDDRWLVYCDDIDQVNEVVAAALERDLPVMEFHSMMPGDRDAVLRSLEHRGGIVVAIRCLDEGVDLPACDRALILASSTVEREYIQRRGRVLRTAKGKASATVHDLVLVDEHGGALTRGEALRALEFARLARNPAARASLQLLLALSSDAAVVPGLAWASAEDDSEGPSDVE